MIEVNDLSVSFNDKKVLKNISTRFKLNEITTILGGSGSGKSTFFNSISGVIPTNEGVIITPDNLKIGYLFQHSALFDSMSVFDNIAFPLKNLKTPRKNLKEIVHYYIKLVGLEPSIVSSLLPSELSGGMQKRISLARTLAFKPDIILFDEPTSGLDPIASRLISDLILNLNFTLNITAIIISHDLIETLYVSHNIKLINDGIIIKEGEPNKFIKGENDFIDLFFNSIFSN